MPQVKKLVRSEYWTADNTIGTPLFRKYMTLNRFRQLLRFLHFADNNEPNYEYRLWKIGNVFTKIVAKFHEYCYPKQKLVINSFWHLEGHILKNNAPLQGLIAFLR